MKVTGTINIALMLNVLPSVEAFVPTASHRMSLKGKTSVQPWASTKRNTRARSMVFQMAAYPILEDWTISSDGGIRGVVTKSSSPALANGDVITTSKLVTDKSLLVDGTTVETSSGSKYILGTKKDLGGNMQKFEPKPPSSVPMPTLDFWSLTSDGEITGIVTNYSGNDFVEGEKITTSPLSSKMGLVEGRTVTTISNNKYKLGQKSASSFSAPVTEEAKPSMSLNLFNNIQKDDKDQKSDAEGPSKKRKPARFASVGRGITKGVGRDSMSKGQAANPKESTTSLQKKKPARFASVGRGITKGVGRDSMSKGQAAIPVLNEWTINNRDEIVGIISGSPYPNEKDGKKFTTAEVATNLAFVEEGFTVLTLNNRKFLLGEPKGGSKKDYNDEMAEYVVPTLTNWDADADLRITGIVRGSKKNPKFKDGVLITTDAVISDAEFIDNRFTICTESGMMYKLGKRQKGRDVSGATSIPAQPTKRGLPNISLPDFSSSGDDADAIKNPMQKNKSQSSVTAIQSIQDWTVNRRGEIIGTLANGEKIRTSELVQKDGLKQGVTVSTISGSAYKLGKRQAATPVLGLNNRASNKSGLPILDDWVVTPFGGVSGTVTNSPFPNVSDGEILTTSKLQDSIEYIGENKNVLTVNGSRYRLGTKKLVSPPRESPPSPILAGFWAIAVIIFGILTEK